MMKAIVVGARGMLAALPALVRDVTGLAGAGLVSYGAWLVYVPAGFVTGGVLLMAAALLAARAQRPGA